MTMIRDVMRKSEENVMNGCSDHSLLSRDSGLDDQSDSSGRLTDSISIYEDAVDLVPSSAASQTSDSEVMENLSETERLRSLKKILDTFFNNKIREAETQVEQHVQTCVNHSHVKMYFSAMSAMMTLDPVS